MKILYFDYWTIGIKNFQRFDHLLKNHGYETKLFHLSSWKGINAPNHQKIQGIDCYDIKYYKTNSIFRVIQRENPRAVVMLNCSQTTDRTIILTCKALGIKTIYLMHGSITRENFIEDSIKSINQILKQNKVKRALKHLKGTIWNYLHSLIKYDFSYLFRPHGYKTLLNTFIDPATFLNFPPPSFDLTPNLSLVYGNIDKEYYGKFFLNSCTDIQVVGNPDLDGFFDEFDTIGLNREAFLSSHHIPLHTPYNVYIEEGLVEDKIWNNLDRLAFIEEIAKNCIDAGFHLVIKLHPRTSNGPNRNTLHNKSNITVLDQVNFPKLIFFSNKCISHYSTTLIYPILLNKPILIPRWGRSSSLQNIYNDQEVTFVKSVEKFKELLSEVNFHYQREKFLQDYVPFNDGKASERIVKNILEAIQ